MKDNHKMDNNIIFFCEEDTAISFFEKEVVFNEEIIVFDYIFEDLKNNTKKYICFFPNLLEKKFKIEVEGVPAELSDDYLALVPVLLNDTFAIEKRIVEIPFEQKETPKIRINGRIIIPQNNSKALSYMRGHNLMKRSVFFLRTKKKHKFINGNRYRLTCIPKAQQVCYDIIPAASTRLLYNELDLFNNIVVKKAWRIKIEYYIFNFLLEIYYKLGVYHIKNYINKFISNNNGNMQELPFRIETHKLKELIEEYIKDNSNKE